MDDHYNTTDVDFPSYGEEPLDPMVVDLETGLGIQFPSSENGAPTIPDVPDLSVYDWSLIDTTNGEENSNANAPTAAQDFTLMAVKENAPDDVAALVPSPPNSSSRSMELEEAATPATTNNVKKKGGMKPGTSLMDLGHQCDDTWDEHYNKLEAYYQEHGDTNVPNNAEYTSLFSWTTEQKNRRAHWKKNGSTGNGFSPVREAKLNALNFQWSDLKEENFTDGYARLEKLHDGGQDLNEIPIRVGGKKNPDWKFLHRQQTNATNLPEDRLVMFAALDIDWAKDELRARNEGAAREAAVIDMLALKKNCKKWKDNYGQNVNAIPRTVTNDQGGKTVSRDYSSVKKYEAKVQVLPEEALDLLVDVGFNFAVSEKNRRSLQGVPALLPPKQRRAGSKLRWNAQFPKAKAMHNAGVDLNTLKLKYYKSKTSDKRTECGVYKFLKKEEENPSLLSDKELVELVALDVEFAIREQQRRHPALMDSKPQAAAAVTGKMTQQEYYYALWEKKPSEKKPSTKPKAPAAKKKPSTKPKAPVAKKKPSTKPKAPAAKKPAASKNATSKAKDGLTKLRAQVANQIGETTPLPEPGVATRDGTIASAFTSSAVKGAANITGV